MHLAICRFGFDKNILIVSFASPRIKDIETATPKQPSKRFQREVVALLVMDAPRLVVFECATRVEHFEVGHSPAPAEHVAQIRQEIRRFRDHFKHGLAAQQITIQAAMSLGKEIANELHSARASAFSAFSRDRRVDAYTAVSTALTKLAQKVSSAASNFQ